ncbi:MAG TPA: PHP domain-containing protein, partial [Chthoniobacteraceae bacterium]|nr:PHP domain-containing protein [Chthoniobacteraceae bacterium]
TRDPALLVACRTEEEIFEKLGLAYIPPELREDQGEFAAASAGDVPRLVEWTELRGSLHNHSTWSDGRCTTEEIARHMIELGLDYWAITDHSKTSVIARGLTVERVREQIKEVKALNERLAAEGIDFRLLTGTEVDILSDGSLDFPDDLLAELDVVVADPILDNLRLHPDVIRCSTAGSVRRCKEIIGDIDFLVSSKQPLEVIEYFVQLPGVISVNAKGETKATVILEGGIQADLRVVSDQEFPFALAYFTGSKEHNIVMRQRAIERGLRLNEYGLFRSKEETRDPALLVACRTEEEIFEKLGLAYIPPELREDQGEFAAASANDIPRLVEWTELRGSLHNHTTWSDGRCTTEEIARHMIELGLDYWAITDHSKTSVIARGLTVERVREQIKEVKALNERLAAEGIDLRLLTGTEVDILSDGSLDFPDDLLAELDVVVASVHQAFTHNEAEMTKRIIRAVENPFVQIVGHMTGRLLLEREAYKVNQHAVIDACAETGTWIELNASPYRLDLDWRLWSYAKSKGVKCVINCDAHRNEHAMFLRLGATVARKGWLTKQDVMNTLPLPLLMEALQKKRTALVS